ncbi:MAG: hypothetical protein NTY02_14150, partial [Acidobacteria bacterium]|nr:hypothetical protein [Acidobacteriota bacterium]
PGLILRFNLLCLVVMPSGFAVGSFFGLNGVCWAWLLLYPAVAVVWFSMTRGLIGYAWAELFSALAPAAVCTASMGLVVLMVRLATVSASGPVWQVAILVAAGVVSYGAVLAVGFRQQVQEIREIVFSRA